jgi:DNA repair protein RecO (recombination protein O)
MLHKTRGIVLKNTAYSESSVVVQIFTEKFGIQSYLINGVKKPKAKIKNNILQPLHLLDLVVYHKQTGDIQRVAEVRQASVFQTIPYDIVKSSIALFLNEVIYKCIKHQGPDESLFEFIFRSVELLDNWHQNLGIFHLHFLLRLTRNLGFYPEIKNGNYPYFDLKEGSFLSVIPTHPLFIQAPYTGYLQKLLQNNYASAADISIPVPERRFLLERVLEYYRLHIEGFGEVRSHQILEEVLN